MLVEDDVLFSMTAYRRGSSRQSSEKRCVMLGQWKLCVGHSFMLTIMKFIGLIVNSVLLFTPFEER